MKKVIVLGITLVIAVAIAVMLIILLKHSEADAVVESQSSATEEMIQGYYQNAISSQDLQDKLKTDDSDLVYFFSSKCPYCKAMTFVLMSLAKEYNIDVTFVDAFEDESVWEEYSLLGTPTIIYFKNGKEVDRIEGFLPEQNTREFFDYYFK